MWSCYCTRLTIPLFYGKHILQVEKIKIFLTQKSRFPHDSKVSSFLNLTPHDLSTSGLHDPLLEHFLPSPLNIPNQLKYVNLYIFFLGK